MSPLLKQAFIAIALLAGAGAGTAYLLATKPEVAQREVFQKQLLIDVAEAVPQDIAIPVTSQGVVQPRTDTALISEVSGQVIYVAPGFQPGGFFKPGEVILKLDDRNYLADVKRAEANVASARSALALEKGRAEVAYQDWLKFRSDVSRSKEAEDLALHKPQLADAQAKLDFALAELDRAKGDLSRTVIRAPFHGLLREKSVDLGQFVTTGTRLGRLSDVEVAEVRLAVADDRLSYLNLNPGANPEQQADVILSTTRGEQRLQWRAKLVRTEGVFDEASRVLFVIAEVRDPYLLGTDAPQTDNGHSEPLRFGSFVNASITGRKVSGLIALPRHVIRNGNKVWIVDSNNALVSREVKLLRGGGDIAYIESGIAAGERIALSAIPTAIDGTRIAVNQELKSDAAAQAAGARRQSDGHAG